MYDLVDPRGLAPVHTSALAPRPQSIPARARLGFLINEVSRKTGPDFFAYTEVIEAEARTRVPDLEIYRDCKPILSRPAGDDLLAHYRDCSGVVAGLAK